MHRPLIVAHRGASALAPENTLAAFGRAIDDGAEGIEFDVRLAKDGVAVVFHDEMLNRTALREGKIADFTSAELSKLDVGTWFNNLHRRNAGPENSLQRISTLAQTFEFLKDFKGLIYVELKCEDPEIPDLVAAVCEACADSALEPQVIIKSFSIGVIPSVRSHRPELRTAALFAPKVMTMLRKEKYLVNIAEEFGANELSLHYSLATRKLMEAAGKRGLPVAIWTADNPRWVKRGIKLGLKAIITNDPARLLAKRYELLNSA
jgi:glycerophosphoryl diester phosphodiesterase